MTDRNRFECSSLYHFICFRCGVEVKIFKHCSSIIYFCFIRCIERRLLLDIFLYEFINCGFIADCLGEGGESETVYRAAEDGEGPAGLQYSSVR